MSIKNENLFEASVQIESARKLVKKHLDEKCNGEDRQNILLKIAGISSIIENMGKIVEQPENQASLFDEIEEKKEESVELDEDEVERELEALRIELEEDKKTGLLSVDDESNTQDYYLSEDEKELIINKHVEAIMFNLPAMSKTFLDTKWKQNANPDKIVIESAKEDDRTIINSIKYTNEFGVKIAVPAKEIIEMLNKIDFN